MSEYQLELSSSELIGLFLILEETAVEKDPALEGLLERLREILYERLSIEEMERLPELYAQKIDVLNQKG